MEDAGAAGGVGGADSLLRAAFRAGGEGAGGVREGVPVLIELPDRFEWISRGCGEAAEYVGIKDNKRKSNR